MNCTVMELLISMAVDAANTLVWFGSEDGKNNTNRPNSISAILMNKIPEGDIEEFESGDDFMKAWAAQMED